MFLYDAVGRTLEEVNADCGPCRAGYSVFVLQSDEDTTGKEIGTDFSIKEILKDHPEYNDWVVKYENDFFGITVLRIWKERYDG